MKPMNALLRAVAEVFAVPRDRLCGARRFRQFVRARQAFMLLARREGYSFPKIARHLGNRDHTTIMYGCARAEKLIGANADYAALVDQASREAAEDMALIERREGRYYPAEGLL